MYDFRDYGHGIYLFDTEYVRPHLAGAYLVVQGGRAAFFDTGTNHSVAYALDMLRRLGLSVDSVDFVIVSHVHLDHAGGAGKMMGFFPHARLVVHPRGVRHMVEPAKLIAGVTAVYGAEYVARMYGNIVPVENDRILEARHGFKLNLAGRQLCCLDTPGHARHHICLADSLSGAVFTGDMFGLSYPCMAIDGHPFIFPTTTPTQFEPDAMRSSLELLMQQAPTAFYLTHYGCVSDVEAMRAELERRLDAHQAIAWRHRLAGVDRQAIIRDALTEYLLAERQAAGCRMAREQVLEWWAGDLDLNAQGLVCWLDGLTAKT